MSVPSLSVSSLPLLSSQTASGFLLALFSFFVSTAGVYEAPEEDRPVLKRRAVHDTPPLPVTRSKLGLGP